MGIETTWMKKGHGPDGIIGSTNQPDTIRTFAYSYHDCIELAAGNSKTVIQNIQLTFSFFILSLSCEQLEIHI